jgi:tetratricopeptide (TPR) repeat protein
MQSLNTLRVLLFLNAAFVLLNSADAQNRNPDLNVSRPSDVEVRLSFENDRPAPGQIRVQLLTITGSTVAEQYTRDQAQVSFHNVSPGNYRLRASGIDIEDAEVTITVEPRLTRFEYLQVKPRKSADQQTSTMGSISSAELNIPDKARKEFDKGVSSMTKSDIDEARKHFSKAAEIYPQYAAAFNNLGVLAMKSGDSEAGKGFFETAVKADSSNANAYLNLARCLIMQDKIQEAEQMLVKASSLNPNDAESLTLLAKAQLMTGELDMAIVNAHKVHSLEHQRFAIAHLVAASAYEKKNQMDEAIAEYKLFLKESPDSPKAANVRAALQTLENRVK